MRRTPDPQAAAPAAIRLRPIAPDDFNAFKDFVRRLSFGTRYFRYGRGDFSYSDEDLHRRCEPLPGERVQWVALAAAPAGQQIVGSAGYVIQPDGASAEMSIVVDDQWRGHGVGRQLLQTLIDQAREQGLSRMFGKVLGTNTDMIEFASRLGFQVDHEANAPLKTVIRTIRA